MPSKKRPTDEPSPRDRILLAAHALFYGQGIRATGIDRIIDAASVTKVTFYRHYPSKESLVIAYLEFRHERWMQWFRESLAVNLAAGESTVDSLANTLRDWFESKDFRGCAFLNAAAEFGSTHPDILKIVRDHKHDVAQCLNEVFESSHDAVGREMTVVVDGAIVHAQMGIPTEILIGAVRNLAISALAK